MLFRSAPRCAILGCLCSSICESAVTASRNLAEASLCSYCPNETNDERLIFKNYFNQMVDKRVRGLIRAGREVMVVGDLVRYLLRLRAMPSDSFGRQNICHSPIDSAEADQRTKDQGLANFTDHPPRKWLNEFIGPDGPMIDITRRLHPTRAFMYTCESRLVCFSRD